MIAKQGFGDFPALFLSKLRVTGYESRWNCRRKCRLGQIHFVWEWLHPLEREFSENDPLCPKLTPPNVGGHFW